MNFEEIWAKFQSEFYSTMSNNRWWAKFDKMLIHDVAVQSENDNEFCTATQTKLSV